MTKHTSRARIVRPPSQLSSLVTRPGGLPREIAIARGTERLEAQRAPARANILKLIGLLEAMAGLPAGEAQLRNLCLATDQLIALAMAFDMGPLAKIGKRLGELIQAFTIRKDVHSGAIAVHVRALRLFAAGEVASCTVDGVLVKLDLVLAHLAPIPQAAIGTLSQGSGISPNP